MLNNFVDAMAAVGLVPGEIVLNGQCQRIPTADHPRSKDGWYYAREINGKIFANYGNWRNGETGIFRGGNGQTTLTGDERAALAILAAQAKKELEERQLLAGVMAEYEYSHALIAPLNHTYLLAKGLTCATHLGENGELLIPIYDNTGTFSTLQRIYSNGRKKLYYGGKKKGCCHIIPGDDNHIFICEGWATGQSINSATGNKVLVAIDSGNLLSVAQTARKFWPNGNLTVASDNDHNADKNVGLQCGAKAAESISASHVYPPDTIKGSDFNDLLIIMGPEKTATILDGGEVIEVMSMEDAKEENLSIDLSSIPLPGLLGLGMAGLSAPGLPNIPQYNFPVVVAALANAIAGKIAYKNKWPNIFNIKVGPTSSGKSESDKVMKLAIRAVGLEGFYGMTDIASGAALYRGLESTPQTILAVDEISFLFQRNGNGKKDPIAESKLKALLDIYSESGQEISKAFGNSKNAIKISNPCLTLTGNATSNIFDAFEEDDFRNGLLPRLDFFCYDGLIPYREEGEGENTNLASFVKGISSLVNINTGGNLQNVTGVPFPIPAKSQCVKHLARYSRDNIDRSNVSGLSEGIKGIIGRSYDLAIKYAMIHVAATRSPKELTEPITMEDIEWGMLVAKIIREWKISKLTGQITSGQFHKDCEIFKSAILASMKTAQKPTFKLMANRKRQLKNWEPAYSEKIIRVLSKRGEILIDETGRKTAYFLVKES